MATKQRRPGTGSKRERSPGRWEIKYEAGADPATGARRTRTETIRGTATDSEKALRARLTAVDRNEEVAPSKMTVSQLVEARIKVWQGLGDIRHKTAEDRLIVLRAWISPHIGKIPIQKLTAKHIEDWHATLLSSGRTIAEGGLGISSCRTAHRLVSHALYDAVKHNLVPRNVAALQGGPKGEVKPIEILQVDKDNGIDEIGDMLAGLQEHWFHDPAVVTLYTGLRRGESLALPWKHVKLDQRIIEVRVALEQSDAYGVQVKATKTKSGLRDITMPQVVVDVLRARRARQLEQRVVRLNQLADDALVFPDENGSYQKPDNFSTAWNRFVRRHKLPIVSWHALRHTHASMLIDANVNIVTISKRMGHKSADITLKVYAHLFKTDDREAAVAIDQMFASK